MPIDVQKLIGSIRPEETVLLFGAGSSMPSGAPSVADLQRRFESRFQEPANGYTMAEQTGIIEHKTGNRAGIISELRDALKGVRPTGAVLNLSLYDWKSIYTTNYDNIIEDTYSRRGRSFNTYSSNYDFGPRTNPGAIQIFKLHGSIDRDVVDGSHSRIIITQSDYDKTLEYREHLYDRFRSDLAGSHLIIIGHSLSDPDIKSESDRALDIILKQGLPGPVTLFAYTRDAGRATLFEARGPQAQVCFGGIDDFFAALAARIQPQPQEVSPTGDPLEAAPALHPWTIDVSHARAASKANVSAMFNGFPASFGDIAAGYTFKRNIVSAIATQFARAESPYALIVGPSGTGKTTAARQALLSLLAVGVHCWEHKIDQRLLAGEWRKVARRLRREGQVGCLFVDDAHEELGSVNELADYLSADQNQHLRIILATSAHNWRPRVKSPALHRLSVEYSLRVVEGNEIDDLLRIVNDKPDIKRLTEAAFSGFSSGERRRRLVERCNADMFVCLKNIFSSEKLDDIVLREYADLATPLQEVYRIVAAMEASGVRVHRQLVLRLLGIPAGAVAATLDSLTDIIHEETVDEKLHIYGWRGRHRVITSIIADHKYYDRERRYALFEQVIDALQPTYDIEMRTLLGLCTDAGGIVAIPDRRQQNILFRKLVSIAPRERVPRHRLMRNLIALGEWDAADTELRIFEKDFRTDGPAARYKIDLAVARALNSPGLMNEDRIVLLEKAQESAISAVSRFRDNKAVVSAYCELGLRIAEFTGSFDAFEKAIAALRLTETHTSDADVTRRITNFEARAIRVSRKEPKPVEADGDADADADADD